MNNLEPKLLLLTKKISGIGNIQKVVYESELKQFLDDGWIFSSEIEGQRKKEFSQFIFKNK